MRSEDFQAVYRELYPSLSRYVHRFTGDTDAAADIVQDAFAVALAALPQHRQGGADEAAVEVLFEVLAELDDERDGILTINRFLSAAFAVKEREDAEGDGDSGRKDEQDCCQRQIVLVDEHESGRDPDVEECQRTGQAIAGQEGPAEMW